MTIKYVIFFIVLSPLNCLAQNAKVSTKILQTIQVVDSNVKSRPSEKLYLQLDKPYYALGDTIWLKAYLFNAPTLLFSAKSGLLHIDITSDSGKLVQQYILPVNNGISWGNISLDSIDFKTGTYILRAYTNWMRNFGDAGFYYKQFYVAGRGENSWLINAKVSTSGTNDKQTVDAKLQFTDINKLPVANTPMQLKVYAGAKNWYKQQVQTDKNGALDVNFAVPAKSPDLSIVAQSGQEKQKATIPISLSRPEKTDIQFLPEGGSIVAGLPANIGFKAIGEDGKGADVSGIITDHNGQQVAAFQSLHNGMGSFKLLVKVGESYTAKVTLEGGARKEFSLPVVKSSGIILQVKNVMESDSVEVSVAATDDIARSNNSYFLIGKSRGIICYAATFDFRNSNFIHKKIAKSLFPSGITHFILTTTSGQPLNERLSYIDHHDNLHIEVTSNKSDYARRDSVGLRLRVTDKDGNPVAGNFSLAVTDNAQVENDTLKQANLISYTLVSSELKGYIEDPGYYMQTKNAQALDNLLLTQGWVNYDWQENKQTPLYEAESEFTVKGQVVNTFNKPVKGTHVDLLSKSPRLVSDTITDKNGLFVFNNFPRIDTLAFVLKAVNKNGKSFNVGIKMDETAPPVFAMAYPPSSPWYVNSDAAIINYTKNRDSLIKVQNKPLDGAHSLKEVKIVEKKIVKGSQNLNGPGNADLVLDEKELEKAGRQSWMELLEKKIDGFKQGFFTRNFANMFLPDPDDSLFRYTYFPETNLSSRSQWYFVHEKAVILIIDGILFRDNFYGFTNYLKLHSAEDIKGIELSNTWKYTSKYKTKFISASLEARFDPVKMDFVFIEITTRSGHGPIIDNTPGVYIYKPLPISYPKQFYKPKYTVNDTAKRFPDLRSTIDWEPNVITDKNGEATVSFYAADKPATYTITIEGTDGNGNLGYKRQKLTISTKGNKAK